MIPPNFARKALLTGSTTPLRWKTHPWYHPNRDILGNAPEPPDEPAPVVGPQQVVVRRHAPEGSAGRSRPPVSVGRYPEMASLHVLPQGPGSELEASPKIDVIWNMTLVCPWPCPICCVDAVHVTRKGGQVILRSHGLARTTVFSLRERSGSIFDQAMQYRQAQGLELDLAGKLRVLDHLVGCTPKIDFSGGDPLAASENLVVLQAASRRFGPQQITLTATGAGLARIRPHEIAPLIGELNFTFDAADAVDISTRPTAYASGNLRGATEFHLAGVRTRAECPLSRSNLGHETLKAIYLRLHEAGIDKLLLMRLFPVGRGASLTAAIPTAADYRRAIGILRGLEAQYGTPALSLQCALRFLDDTVGHQENPCDVVRESFGLMANGTLLASPWAVNRFGAPLDPAWVLGNLSRERFTDIAQTAKFTEFLRRADDNWGHCKIHSFLKGNQPRLADRIFDTTDPLYSEPASATA